MAFASVLLVSGSANFSTRDVWDGYRVALEQQGIRVIPYPTFSFLKVLSPDAVGNDILGTALDLANGIDCVVFVDGLYFRGARSRIPQSLARAGIPTVLLATDDPYESLPDVESIYTHRFTNEIRCAVRGAVYLPTATLPLPDVPRLPRPPYHISFLGTVFEDRLPTLLRIAEFCEAEGLRFLVAGKIIGGAAPFEKFVCTEVRQRTIETLEKWEIYSQSRVTLNLFRQSEQPADSPSPRVFEVTAFGQAALLTGPVRSEVKRLFGDSVYHFADADGAIEELRAALANDSARIDKVERARAITLEGHLYEHRAEALIRAVRKAERERAEIARVKGLAMDASVPSASTDAAAVAPSGTAMNPGVAVAGSSAAAAEDRLGWVIGCGRTGSTWLAEMLGNIPRIRHWHEPYYGRFFRHLSEHPEELDRKGAFFSRRHEETWVQGLRDLFFGMARARFPQFGRHALVVKEVNTPELYPWLRRVFPLSRVILLLRDPYDVLDSYLDMQKPGSWNASFAEGRDPLDPERVRRTAEHIRETTALALRTYDETPPDRRIRLSYEELLVDPVPGLAACGGLLSVDIDPVEAREIVERFDFRKYEQTGPLEFRRKGQAGGWRTSENFARRSPVPEIAGEVLLPLRCRLGYQESSPS